MLDEAHNSPQLFAYLQEFVDDPTRENKFILSSSQNFLLHEKIAQSLAGRIGLYELLPLTYSEYKTFTELKNLTLLEYLFGGQYPRPYNEKLSIKKWIESCVV
ncbi:MAG: AAA family ATPase [Bdellovibrionota bacterium]